MLQQALLVLQLLLVHNVQKTPGIKFVSPLHQVESPLPLPIGSSCFNYSVPWSSISIFVDIYMHNPPVWRHRSAMHRWQRLHHLGLEIWMLFVQVNTILFTKHAKCNMWWIWMSSMPDTAQHSGAHFELKFALVLSFCCMVDKSISAYEQPTQMHCYDTHSLSSLSAFSSDKYHAFGPLNRTILLFTINNQLKNLWNILLGGTESGYLMTTDQVLELYWLSVTSMSIVSNWVPLRCR